MLQSLQNTYLSLLSFLLIMPGSIFPSEVSLSISINMYNLYYKLLGKNNFCSALFYQVLAALQIKLTEDRPAREE